MDSVIQGRLIALRLTKRQPLWVILCRLPEKGRKEIEEEMKERVRNERGKWKKVKEQKLQIQS